MNRSTPVIAALAFVLGLVVIANTFFIVDQRQQVVVVKIGMPVRVINPAGGVDQPGLYLKAPFLESLVVLDKRNQPLEAEKEEVISSDQQRLVVDAFVRYRIADPLQFYRTLRSEANAQTLIEPLINSSLRQVLGGATKRHGYTVEQGRALAERLKALRSEGGLAITPSRRTPEDVKAVLREAFAGDPGVFLWDEAGENPYRGILALSDRIVATGDSVSMVSEAVATGRPVAVFDLGGGKRHQRFIANLFERKLASPADGSPFLPPGGGPGPNATPEASAALRRLIEERYKEV